MESVTINLWAVLAGAAVYMAVGSVWYGALFGKQWRKLMGFTVESMRSMTMTANRAIAFGFVCSLLMAYVLAHFAVLMDVSTTGGALALGFWAWLGLVVPFQAGSYLWEGKPLGLFVLNASNSLVSLLLIAMVVSLWR